MATAKKFKPAAPPKPCTAFRAETEQGRDWRNWQRCGTCRHWGDPDDPKDVRHKPVTVPAAPPRNRRSRRYLADAAELDARRLGETGD